MHIALSQGSVTEQEAVFWPNPPERRPELVSVARVAPVRIEQSSGFAVQRRPNWAAIAIIVVAHALLLYALIKFDVITVVRAKPKPLVVDLLKIAPPPPAAPPEEKVAPVIELVTPPIVSPKPIVVVPTPPVTIAIAREAPPPKAVIVAPTPPAPSAPSAPVSADDLATTMISATPPRYPVEARRRKEQGTVYLSVLVGMDGRVSEIGVSRSSGSDRLDKAALDAVRRWRWSPTVRNGAAVMVRGIVDIPFVLQG